MGTEDEHKAIHIEDREVLEELGEGTHPSNMQAPPNVSCWGCGGPHFQRDFPKGQMLVFQHLS